MRSARINVAIIAALAAIAVPAAAQTKPLAWPAETNTCVRTYIMQRCNFVKLKRFTVTVAPLSYLGNKKWRPIRGHEFPVTIKANCDHGSKKVVLHPTRTFNFKSKYLEGFAGVLAKSRHCHIEASAHPSLADAGGVDWVTVNLSWKLRN